MRAAKEYIRRQCAVPPAPAKAAEAGWFVLGGVGFDDAPKAPTPQELAAQRVNALVDGVKLVDKFLTIPFFATPPNPKGQTALRWLCVGLTIGVGSLQVCCLSCPDVTSSKVLVTPYFRQSAHWDRRPKVTWSCRRMFVLISRLPFFPQGSLFCRTPLRISLWGTQFALLRT